VEALVLYLAGSCVQGAHQLPGLRALLRHAPDGVQLTPGWFPTPGFQALLDRVDLPLRLHHGFAWDAYRRAVWSADELLVTGCAGVPVHSVHPPPRPFPGWRDALRRAGIALEILAPGHVGSSADDLRETLDSGVWLAVDIAHVHLLCVGGLSRRLVDRLLDHDRIAEVHVSASNGIGDVHALPGARTPFVDWARERAAAGVPLVAEFHFRGTTSDDRDRALEPFRC
jgi:hypothetical protein